MRYPLESLNAIVEKHWCENTETPSTMSGWRHALSWFPGHAKKASRDMAERLKHVDIVLEIRDARVREAAACERQPCE